MLINEKRFKGNIRVTLFGVEISKHIVDYGEDQNWI